ncbi:hypothetical protein RQP46_008583 [Phenoliferia psychrophenolica]
MSRLYAATVRDPAAARDTAARLVSPAGTPPLLEPEPSRAEFCTDCELEFRNGSHSEAHYAGMRHKERLRVLAAKRAEESSKHGVELFPVGTADFGTLELSEQDVATNKKIVLVVRTSPMSLCFIMSVHVRSSDGFVSHGYTYTYPAERQIGPASTSSAGTVTFHPRGNAGHYTTDSLVFTFALLSSDRTLAIEKTFTISRPLSGIAVRSLSDVSRFKPTPPFVRKTPGPRAGANVVRAPKMHKHWILASISGGENLKEHEVRGLIRELFGTARRIKDQIEDAKEIVLVMNPETYVWRFRLLLWIQELKAEQELAQHDLEEATLTKRGSNYFLEVPGLVEKRPAVIVGHTINIQQNGTKKFNAGRVTSVSDTEVGLHFSRHLKTSATYLCQFEMNRTVQRRMHEALAGLQARITFPQPPAAPRTSPATPLFPQSHNIISDLVRNNSRQKEAVRAIFNKTHGPAPFILFGPPGTGKTETIVETVKQLVRFDSASRILICAPSNSACDVVASRLVGLGADKLFRLYAPFRPQASVPPALRSFTLRLQGQYKAPRTAEFQSFRVVVVTCASGNLQSRHGIDRGHFSHIFIDECGQAEEPESAIPLAMANERTSVILCGDPKQLGPIVQSPIALHFGLGESLLERLMKLSMYDPSNAAAAGTTVVKLVDNYRSHPKILEFPNREFYGGELRPSATNTTTDAVKLEGIISPYNAQCKKLRKEIRNPAVTVGSVEQFQGQERKVIIVSTVRSSVKGSDSSLGFLSDSKRFNVMMTRAQAGLIIVGDPTALARNPLWCRFLVFIRENGGWSARMSVLDRPPSSGRTFAHRRNSSSIQARIVNSKLVSLWHLSIWSRVQLPVGLATLWAFSVWALHQVGILKVGGGAGSITGILAMVTGLFVSFRSGSSYDRWYEGRRTWSSIQATTRNASRLFLFALPADPALAASAALGLNDWRLLLCGFSIATMHHLRDEYGCSYTDLRTVLPPALLRTCESPEAGDSGAVLGKGGVPKNLPLVIIRTMHALLNDMKAKNELDAGTWAGGQSTLNQLSDSLTALERIRDTPIPMVLQIHLQLLLLVYIAAVPLQLINTLGFWSIPATSIAALVFYGVDRAGEELSDPFGREPNDLPLERFCGEIQSEFLELVGHPVADMSTRKSTFASEGDLLDAAPGEKKTAW